ncbi:ferric reductase-like transmembrane domain-containing protein [Immundisolibacter sp.]|uniref:ferric reductase-like transmembrane domain-containing protein n=1 Tax=Immundisolibacter sp. TaxID=1934948 RepID=UPI00356B2981
MHPSEVPSETEREARDRAALWACVAPAGVLLVVTFAYATLRYVVFGPWSVGHIPLFVLNKAVSWSALWLIALAYALGPLARLAPKRFGQHLWLRRYIGIMGFALACLHVVISIFIFNYHYYRLFFRQAFELTALAEFAMAMGALGWFLLLAPLAASLPGAQAALSARYWRWLQRLGTLAMLFGALHVAYGVPGWLTPEKWYGGLPPITLWSALGVAIVLGLRGLVWLRGKKLGG